MTDGLIGWWKLNGDTKDYSGNKNDAINYASTIINSVDSNGYMISSTQRIDTPINMTTFCPVV